MKDSWSKYKFSELGPILIGGTPSRNIASFWAEKGTGHAWVSIADLSKSGRIINNTKEELTLLGVKSSNVKLITAGSIIFSFKLSVGKKAFTGKDLYTNEAIAAFKFNPQVIESSFLFYALEGIDYSKVTDSAIKGVTLNKEKLNKLEVLLPPLPQQKKIANILSTCDAVIEKTEAAIAKYQDIKQGMMHDLFTRGIDLTTGKLRPTPEQAPDLYKDSELGKIPKDWEVGSIGKLTELIKDGSHGTHKDVSNGIPLLSAKDINDGRLSIPEDARQISEIDFNQIHKNYKIETNDILITLVGTIGRVAMIKDVSLRYTFQRSVGILRFYKHVVTPIYGFQFLSTEVFYRNLVRSMNASAQGGVYLGELGKLRIPFPNMIKEQKEISYRLSKIDSLISLESKDLLKHQKIKSGLMQDLLTGKVEVKVELEETA